MTDFDKIRRYLPNDTNISGNGNVLLTTRNFHFGNTSYFSDEYMIYIDHLNPYEQVELFCKVFYGNGNTTSHEKQIEIANFLKNIYNTPLDISTAANYMKITGNSLETYNKIIAKSSAEFTKIHSNVISKYVGYSSTRYSIVTSIFYNILKNRREFNGLLLLTCLVGSKNIPKKFLIDLRGQLLADEFLCSLQTHSTIVVNSSNFSLHRNTQKIGLDYILSILTANEKMELIDSSIKILTNYNHIRLDAGHSELWAMLPHLNSAIRNINETNIENKNECITKLMLAKFYVYNDMNSPKESNQIGEKILNANKNYVKGYDLAVLLNDMTYNCLTIGEYEKAGRYISECKKIYETMKGANTTGPEVINLAYSGGLNSCLGLYNKAFENFVLALDKLKMVDNLWLDTARAIVFYQYHHCCVNHYIDRKKIENVIVFMLDILKSLGYSDFIYKKNNYTGELPFFVPGLRYRLSVAYNRLGLYEKALECENEAYYFYNDRRKKNNPAIVLESSLDIEYGYTLLRKNNLELAYKILKKAIDTKLKISDVQDLFRALVYFSEVCIRQEKAQEAYVACSQAMKYKGKNNQNYEKIMHMQCIYNMAIAKYKEGDFKQSIEHFSEFFVNAKEFCKILLSETEYNSLLRQKSFENQSSLKICLTNSFEISKSIYGKNHAFVTNYVMKLST